MSRLAMCAVAAAVGWLAFSSPTVRPGLARAEDAAKVLPFKLLTHKVKPEKLPVQFSERGVLESVNSRDVVCQVKAKSQGSAATSIKWLIDEGIQVQVGDKLMELDDSAQQDALANAKIALDQAEDELIAAKANLEVQLSQNESDNATARLSVELAEINLEKYLKGDFLQLLQDIKARTVKEEADVEQWKESLGLAESKLKAKETTEDQVRVVRLRLEAAQLLLKSVQLELQVLQKQLKPLMEKELRAKVDEAKRSLMRVERQAIAKEASARGSLKAKESVYGQKKDLYNDAAQEVKNCLILATQAGMVVYYVPVTRSGQTSRGLVALGEPVREGQKLMTIQNPGKVQLAIRVPEALVGHVRPGMTAQVQIDAFPNRPLRGTVSRLAPTPSVRDGLRTDEKVYATAIQLEGNTEGLRPGMSASATIDLGKTLENVLVVPARSLIGKAGIGKTVSCLVLTKEGIEEREVVIGLFQDTKAGIVSGLHEGDEVIVNPRLFLDEIQGLIRVRGK